MIHLRPHEPGAHSLLCRCNVSSLSLHTCMVEATEPEQLQLHVCIRASRLCMTACVAEGNEQHWETSGLQDHYTQLHNQLTSESACLTTKGANNCMGRQWDVATSFILIPCKRALENHSLDFGKSFASCRGLPSTISDTTSSPKSHNCCLLKPMKSCPPNCRICLVERLSLMPMRCCLW